MTLPLASVGLANRSPTATWWFPPEEPPTTQDKFPRKSGFGQGASPQTRILWMALLAFVAIFIALIVSGARIRGYFVDSGTPARLQQAQSPDQSGEANPANPEENVLLPSRDVLRATNSDHVSPDPFAVTALAYQIDPSDGARQLLNHYRVAMVDVIRDPLPSLDLVIELKLPGSGFNDRPVTGPRSNAGTAVARSRLARITVYWPEEGDFYTRNRKSSTGVRLRNGHCAVDPKVIPYGSVVNVPAIGPLIAVDTGSAVISRRASRVAGRTREQRNAIVIDVFCSSRSRARALMNRVKHFAIVSWQQPERLSGL